MNDRFVKELSSGGFPICLKHEEIEELAYTIFKETTDVNIKSKAFDIMTIITCCRDDAINMERALKNKNEIISNLRIQ